jgi:SAM-dependent methyltransferase
VNQEDPYALIAEWYDLEHDAVVDDLECYTGLLGNHSSGRGRVLEVGSGTGRIVAALASAGYQVTGVEPSAAMRQRAELRVSQLPERVARRVHLVAGDALDLGDAAKETFDAVVYGLNTFAHLTDLAERQRALATVAGCLVGGGLILLDLDLAGPRRLLRSAGQQYRLGRWRSRESGELVSHLVSGTPGKEAGTILVTHLYEVSVPGHEPRRTTTHMLLALLSAGELKLEVQSAGFTVLAVHGGFDLSPYDDLSGRAILLARLPGSRSS